MGKEQHRFGSNVWTQEKLEALKRYLEAYSLVMKNQPFSTGYIDAFAGTGKYTPRELEDDPDAFPDLFQEDAEQFLDGSASIALKVEPGFQGFVFIEKDKKRLSELENLRR